jgi:hypothetical protein
MTMPFEEWMWWFQREIVGQTGGAIGSGVAGDAGAVQGRQIAMGLNVDPWMPKWTPSTLSAGKTKGEVLGMVGLLADDGTLLDPATGEPMDQARADAAMRLLLGPTMDRVDGASGAALDKALGELARAGTGLLDKSPDERLADAHDATQTAPPAWADGPLWKLQNQLFEFSPSKSDAAPARPAPAPQPALLDVLERMYGGYTVPEPEQPTSIFDPALFGSEVLSPASGPPTAPSSPLGSVGVTASPPVAGVPPVPPVVGAPPAPPGTSLGGILNAPRTTGAVGGGALYQPPAAAPRTSRPQLWPPTPAGELAELFDAASPDAPRFSRGRDRAAAPRRYDDDGDRGDLVDPWSLQEGAIGAVEAISELVLGTAEDMLTNALYMTPIGIPLAIYNIHQAAGEIEREMEEHGGGVLGFFGAINQRYNPLVGLATNTIELVEAVEDEDARKVGNRSVKVAIQVLAMAAMLRGGGKRSGAPGRTKPVNLPSLKQLKIDMDHIRSGHMKGGHRLQPGANKDVFPETMSDKQVEAAVREAYQNGQRIKTQSDLNSTRVLVEGTSGGLTIRIWVNLTDLKIETAWPKYR